MNWTYFWMSVSGALYALGALSHYRMTRAAQAEANETNDTAHPNLRRPGAPFVLALRWPSFAFSLLFDSDKEAGA